MEGRKKHASWMDTFQDYPTPPGISENLAHGYTIIIDDVLHSLWELGRNTVLCWAPKGQGMALLVAPHYRIAEMVDIPNQNSVDAPTGSLIENIVSGSKLTTLEDLEKTAKAFDIEPRYIKLPFTPGEGLSLELITALVRRYSISLVKDRAVALLDIVGFSLLSPLEQVTQLNSLSYSVNAAHSKLLDREIKINFARTTTGDGFYIWNRTADIRANVDLYKFLHLILADNAIAQEKSTGKTTPLLRACLHVGAHYEYYQAVSLSPTTFSYIVGDVTIELARMIERSLPCQVLIGDFDVPMPNPQSGDIERINTIEFIKRTRDSIGQLHGINLSGDTIESIQCYLTGKEHEDGSFGINRYLISDKHGLTRNVFNAKINIHRKNEPPLYLGIQDSEMSAFEVMRVDDVTSLGSVD